MALATSGSDIKTDLMTLRVAQIAPLFESVPPKYYGGTERVIDNLTKGLLKCGVDVTVFCSGDSTTSGNIEAVWPEALRLSRTQIRDPLAYQMRMLDMVAQRADEFNIIHNHYDYPLLSLARMTTTPLISTIHGRLDVPRQDIRAVYDRFTDVPLVSISNAQRVPMPHLNWASTIHHGMDVSRSTFFPTAGKYLAFLGRFSPEKRPDWAIDIAMKSGIPLKLAAKIDEQMPEYYETKVKNRIDGKFIEYVGEITEKEKCDFLGNALALVFPIDWPEPFGLVMTEAMACGTPVLARPRGSVPEIVIDGKTGFIRESIDDLAKLAEKTAALDRAQIRKHVENNFSVERMTQEYLNVYKQLERPTNVRRMADDRRHLVHPVDSLTDRHTKDIA